MNSVEKFTTWCEGEASKKPAETENTEKQFFKSGEKFSDGFL